MKIKTTYLSLASLVLATCCQSADFFQATELFKSGQYDQCLEHVSTAIEDEEYGEQWYVLKIETEMVLGRYSDALSTLTAALRVHPNGIRVRWFGHRAALMNDEVQLASKLLDEIHQLNSLASWRYRDSANQLILGWNYLKQGADAKAVMDRFFRSVLERVPTNVDAHLAIAQLGLDKQDFALAAEHFRKAVEFDSKNPDAHFGIAQAFEPSDTKLSGEALQTAIQLNPWHVPSLLYLINNHIDAERYADAEKLIAQVLKINPLHPQAWAYRAVVAHLSNEPAQERLCRDKALSTWRGNPEVDYLIGKKLSQKYRFQEGAGYQRRALVYDKTYLPAKVQLSQDLLRLGQELEGWKLADEVYDEDAYSIVGHNLVTLRGNISSFETIETEDFTIRMGPREAAIYGDQVLQLLDRARQELCAKYEFEISKPVVVEIFPRQQDFAIRTFGMPGGAGFLGVCFGQVITMNSPAAQGSSLTNWQSVLWHEFCHVVTLQKTDNKMPRWLSEGISVYEERQANPAWGQSMNESYREMILSDDLTPVSQLSGAFLSPASPAHLQFAYYESSLVVEYLIEQYGLDVLKRVLVDLGVGMTINQALDRYTGSVEILDKEFAEFAIKRATEYGEKVDLTKPDPELLKQPGAAVAWMTGNPQNFYAQQQYARYLIQQAKWNDAKEQIAKLIDLHPEYSGPDNGHVLLAQVSRELGDIDEEKSALERVVQIDASDLDSHLRLVEILASQQQWEQTVQYAQRALAINPLLPAPHRYLALAAQETGDHQLAISALRAQTEMNPLDPADLHYRLALLLHDNGQAEEARRQVLKALEQAPRYRDAHRLLLELVPAGGVKDALAPEKPSTNSDKSDEDKR